MAEGQLELEFTTRGAQTVLETIALVKRNAAAHSDVSQETGIAAQKQRELADSARKAAQASKEKAQAEQRAATSAEREAVANERTASASANSAHAKQQGNLGVLTSGGIAGGLGNGGKIEIKGANEFRASSEVFSAGIQAAGVVLATASVAMQDSASKFMQAAGKISSYAGMGWGLGQSFGQRGGIAGAVLGLAYGLTSELTRPLFEKWAGTDEETKEETERLRKKALQRRQSAYDEEKYELKLSQLKTADEAKSLVKSLEGELADARMKFKHGLDGNGTMQERQAKIATLENRLKAAQGVEIKLVAQERAKTEAARFNQIDEIERNAGRMARDKEWQRSFGEAETAKKIEMLTAKLDENSRVLAEENKAFREKSMSQAQFDWHRARYETALAEKINLQDQIHKERQNLKEETQKAAKDAEEKAEAAREKRASDIASEYNDATRGFSIVGNELQRAGITYGGKSSTAVQIAQITAENVKNILATLQSGQVEVVAKKTQPVVS